MKAKEGGQLCQRAKTVIQWNISFWGCQFNCDYSMVFKVEAYSVTETDNLVTTTSGDEPESSSRGRFQVILHV